MRWRNVWRVPLSLALAVFGVVGLMRGLAPAQVIIPAQGPYGGDGSYYAQSLSGMATPHIPPAGTWSEIIMANNKGVVVQNAAGQQFPISYEGVRQFLIRWPTDIQNLNRNSLIEVTGVDLGTNQVKADHVDIYEGAAQSLVTPTYQNIVGLNRILTAADMDQKETYGVVFPLTPEESAMPNRLHVVGPLAGVNPLQIAIPGNNNVAVRPDVNGISMTQITQGSPSYAKKGDLVYVVPLTFGPKSVMVNLLVLYKKVPLNQFQP